MGTRAGLRGITLELEGRGIKEQDFRASTNIVSWRGMARALLAAPFLAALVQTIRLHSPGCCLEPQGKDREESPSAHVLQRGAQTFLWIICCRWLLDRENHRKAPWSHPGWSTCCEATGWVTSWATLSRGTKAQEGDTEKDHWKKIKQVSAKC